MTRKRLWMFVTFGGVLLFIAGLVLTIVLTLETGEVVDDSQCDSGLQAAAPGEILQAACVTSDDPKVLLGILPLLLGGAMVGIGIWRWIVAASAEGSDGSGGAGSSGGVSGLLGSIQTLQQNAEAMQQQGLALQQQAGMGATAGAAGTQMSVEQAQELQRQAMELAEKAGLVTDGDAPTGGASPSPPTPPGSSGTS